VLSIWLMACRTPVPPPSPEPKVQPEPESGETAETAETAETGETGTVEVLDDCAALVPGPFDFISTDSVQTEEDFDFDAQGYLLTQNGTALAGITRQGEVHVVSPSIGPDAAGIRSLVTGDIVVAQPDTGVLRRVDPLTGSSVVVLSGLSFPNGLEASRDGMIYSSEYTADGRIRMVDPYSGEATVLAQMQYPNNMALSPDERTLYVVAGLTTGRVAAFDRDENDVWSSTPRLVYEHPQTLGGITTDKCGNIYIVEYSAGKVYRLPASDPSSPERIADLTSGSFSSLRFSAAKDDWSPTELFVTNRFSLFAIDVQIAGRHVLSDE
jgi:hypothetical protein